MRNKPGFLASAIDDLTQSVSENKQEAGCSFINIRPTARQVAMLDVMTKLKGRNPTALMQDDISRILALYIRLSPEFIPAVEEALKAGADIDAGALKLLYDDGVIATTNLSIEEIRWEYEGEKKKEEKEESK